jgi:hypothetical protein
MLGTLVLFVGLRRARRVPIWAVLAALVFVVCGSSSGAAAGVLGVLAALAAFVPAARALVTATEPAVQVRASEAWQDRTEQPAHP